MRFIILGLGLLLTGCATAQNFVETSAITKSRLTFPALAASVDQSQQTVDHSAFDNFLSTYHVAPKNAEAPHYGAALLRYSDVTEADKNALVSYINRLQDVQVTSLNRDEQLAFWVNLYNAQTTRVILENYPTDSIRSIKSNVLDFKGPWNDKTLTVEGETLSLDNIENRIVRPLFNDPRIHYALNCAAIGCPNLRSQAYKSAGLDGVLDAQARAYINNPRAIKIEEGRVTASRIFLWYKGDYGGSESTVLDHIRQYARPELRQSLEGVTKIDVYEYDWDLIDAGG